MEQKILIASYTTECAYQIPASWKQEDIFIKNGVLYYKNSPQYAVERLELGGKYPDKMYIDTDDMDIFV